jgi:hypothetical protein
VNVKNLWPEGGRGRSRDGDVHRDGGPGVVVDQ